MVDFFPGEPFFAPTFAGFASWEAFGTWTAFLQRGHFPALPAKSSRTVIDWPQLQLKVIGTRPPVSGRPSLPQGEGARDRGTWAIQDSNL